MTSPQFDLFNQLFKVSQSLGYATYDIRPMSEVGYPFVDFEDSQELHTPTKTDRMGKIPIVLNVWGTHKQRKIVAEMCEKVLLASRDLTSTDWHFYLDLNNTNTRMMVDTSTNTNLVRGILELEFYYS